MKILKKILLGIVFVIAVLLIVALFIGKEISVERSVVIKKPTQQVYDYVKYLKNQNEYSYWASLDPAMKKTFTGTDGTVGFKSAWEGNDEVGKGEQEIVALTPNKRIDYHLHFIEPMESESPAYIAFEDVSPGETKVTWGMTINCSYPMNIMAPIMDGMVGPDLEAGLNNLKTILEK